MEAQVINMGLCSVQTEMNSKVRKTTSLQQGQGGGGHKTTRVVEEEDDEYGDETKKYDADMMMMLLLITKIMYILQEEEMFAIFSSGGCGGGTYSRVPLYTTNAARVVYFSTEPCSMASYEWKKLGRCEMNNRAKQEHNHQPEHNQMNMILVRN